VLRVSVVRPLPDREPDPQQVARHALELLGTWTSIQMDAVDAAVATAQAKAAAIPDQRVLWEVVGELMIRVYCLEAEVAQLKKERRP
jgi:hypothetical protein